MAVVVSFGSLIMGCGLSTTPLGNIKSMHPGFLLFIINIAWIYFLIKSRWLLRVFLFISIGVYDYVNYLLFEMVRRASTHGNTIHGWYSKYNDSEKFIAYLWFILFPLIIVFVSSFFEDTYEKIIDKKLEQTDNESKINNSFNAVQNAIINKSEIEIVYRDYYGNKTNRKILPKEITRKKGNNYLRAFCMQRKSERTFRIDRIIEIRKSLENKI